MRKLIAILLVLFVCSASYADTKRALRVETSRVNNATSGGLLYTDSNSKLAQDASNLFWDDTNKRMGIGISNPAVTLQIVGDEIATDILLNNTAGGDPLIGFALSGTTLFTLGIDNSDSDKFKIGTLGLELNTRFSIDGTGVASFEDNNIINVGDIGIDSISADSGTSIDITANVDISKADPEIRLTDTGDSEFTRITRSDTNKKAQRFNRVTKPGVSISGLVGHWKMNDDAANATVIDSSGNGNNGTFTDVGGDPNTDAHTVTGQINSALNFDAVDDYIDIGSSLIATEVNSSVSIWIKPGQVAGNSGDAIYSERTSSTPIWKLQMSSSGGGGSGKEIEFIHRDNSNSLTRVTGTTDIVTDGLWHHVVMTKSGTSIILYIDSVSDKTGTLNGNDALTVTNSFIGKDLQDANSPFLGPMDDVRAYNKTLSQAEIDLIFDGGSGTEGDSSVVEALVWSSKDGVNDLEEGIQTFGDGNGRTVIDGKTTRFDINSSEIANINASGNLMIGGSAEAATLLEVEDGNATTGIQISNTATDGDPFWSLAFSGVQKWTGFADDGDGDDFKINDGGIGGTTRFRIDGTDGDIQTYQGMIRKTTRVTSNTTLDSTHHKVYFDTDGGAIDGTLPAGIDGREYILYNTGANDVTMIPDGSELIDGVNANKLFAKGMIVLTYETTEGWR